MSGGVDNVVSSGSALLKKKVKSVTRNLERRSSGGR